MHVDDGAVLHRRAALHHLPACSLLLALRLLRLHERGANIIHDLLELGSLIRLDGDCHNCSVAVEGQRLALRADTTVALRKRRQQHDRASQ